MTHRHEKRVRAATLRGGTLREVGTGILAEAGFVGLLAVVAMAVVAIAGWPLS